MAKRTAVSEEATARYEADAALAARFDDLFSQAQESEQALRERSHLLRDAQIRLCIRHRGLGQHGLRVRIHLR